MFMGTAAYMSPEQARGRMADKRSDIWAFGCVLFELLTATRPFDGEEISDVLASVLKTEVNLSALPAGTPARVRELISRSLRKDPRARLQSIGDARVQIDDTLRGGHVEANPVPGTQVPALRHRPVRSHIRRFDRRARKA
jgi:serine/threonine protein kinase